MEQNQQTNPREIVSLVAQSQQTGLHYEDDSQSQL
jgi:hypothetical protein